MPMRDPGFSFISSGSEATDLAFKLARAYWRVHGEGARFKIVSRSNSYHGAGWGGLSATGSDPFRAPFEPIVPGFVRTTSPRRAAAASAASASPARSPARTTSRGSSSARARARSRRSSPSRCRSSAPSRSRTPTTGAASGEVCDAYGVLLIADEVVTGFGRTGRMFASSHWDIEPDLITMAKGLTSRFVPMGAVAVGPRVQEVLGGTPLMHINTYAGHPVACSAALAALAITQGEGLVANAAELEPVVRAALEGVAEGSARPVRTSALGLLSGIEVAVDDPGPDLALEIRHALYARGISVRAGVGDGVAAVLFYPPLTVDEDIVRTGIAAIGDGLRDLGVL